MPCWCKDCRPCFPVRTGTNIEKSRLPFRKRVFAVCLFVTNLAREIKVLQRKAWLMLHRLRESWVE